MRYRVLEPISLPKGTLVGLTEAQAAARQFALRPSVNGLWEVVQAVQFKCGEELTTPGLLPKNALGRAQPVPDLPVPHPKPVRRRSDAAEA
jgi:hypothetical protein